MSTKIHATVDALGNPLRWILTGGEVADVTQASALIEGFDAQTVVADKGYDANAFVALINGRGRCRSDPAAQQPHRTKSLYDRHMYK